MPKVTLFYAQSDPLGLCPKWLSFMPKVTLSVNLCPKWLSLVFGEKVHSVVLACGLCPKWLSFYAQSDPLECRGVNLSPKWLSFMPQVTLFLTLNDLCPKWLKKCALSDPPTSPSPPFNPLVGHVIQTSEGRVWSQRIPCRVCKGRYQLRNFFFGFRK